MYRGLAVGVAIPALDEEASIGFVVGDLKRLRNDDGSAVIDDIVVCDNGSRDATGARAAEAGARVVREARKGYGSACLAAIAELKHTDVVLFTDADHAFHASEASRLLDGVADGADLVIGSRAMGCLDSGAMSATQVFGNRLATMLIRWLWGHRVTDLGPYRAIRAQALAGLGMRDGTFGWTVEMQVKAIQHGLRVVEVPVDTRARIGKSKISGTVRGVIGAGFGILSMIAKLRWRQRDQRTVGDGPRSLRRMKGTKCRCWARS
ncbi:MAG: glycosyltransferase [Gammaproteobacteria bacterium]|nr:glycosyltransferase [Gammaproteobacteria bacterium]